MSKYLPNRKELQFRLLISVLGLSIMLSAVAYRGMPQGPAMFEVIGLASLFFGGTLVWTLKRLIKKEYSEDP